MAWLGVRAGALNLLLPVGEVAEVLPCAACTALPLTRSWFRGLSNVRGSLYSVIDLPALLGYAAVPAVSDVRLLILTPARMRNTALLVNRLVGMVPESALTLAAAQPQPAGGPYAATLVYQGQDADAADWHQLDLAALVAHPDFLEVAQPGAPGVLA